MITDSGQFSEIIGESLSFALTPAQQLPEMIAGGAQLMRKLSTDGLFLPPFAAVDIVTAFYTAGVGRFIFNCRRAITHPRSKLFERRYTSRKPVFFRPVVTTALSLCAARWHLLPHLLCESLLYRHWFCAAQRHLPDVAKTRCVSLFFSHPRS